MSQGDTAAEAATRSTADIPMHRAHIVAVRSLTPAFLEVEVGGLDEFETLGPDTFAYFIVGTDRSPLPDGYAMADYLERDPDGPIRGAYYTVRRHDPVAGVATFWVLRHGHGTGVAGWIEAARPGDPFLVWGPRCGFVPPVDADHLLLVADETGLAAVASIVEAAPRTVTIRALLETCDAAARPAMPAHPRLSIEWLDRGRAPAGGSVLADAVAHLEPDTGTWAAFGGAESHVVTAIRRTVRDGWGIPVERVSMVGYWRRDES